MGGGGPNDPLKAHILTGRPWHNASDTGGTPPRLGDRKTATGPREGRRTCFEHNAVRVETTHRRFQRSFVPEDRSRPCALGVSGEQLS